MTVIINVRNPHNGDTYIARAKDWGTTASSTNSATAAANACAKKISKGRPFALTIVTSQTFLAEISDQLDP